MLRISQCSPRDEAELVLDEVVGLRHRVAHEGGALERFVGLGDQVVLGQAGVEDADHGLDASAGAAVAVDVQRAGQRSVVGRHLHLALVRRHLHLALVGADLVEADLVNGPHGFVTSRSRRWRRRRTAPAAEGGDLRPGRAERVVEAAAAAAREQLLEPVDAEELAAGRPRLGQAVGVERQPVAGAEER